MCKYISLKLHLPTLTFPLHQLFTEETCRAIYNQIQKGDHRLVRIISGWGWLQSVWGRMDTVSYRIVHPPLSLSSSEDCFRSDFDRPHCPLPFPPSGSTIRSPLEIPSSFLTISKPKVDDREAHSVPSTSRSVYKLHPTLPRRSNLSLSLFHQCHLMTRVWTWSILTDLTGWKSQELLMPWKPTCWAFLLRNSSHSQRLAQFLTKYSKDEFTSIPSVNLEEWRWVSWNH